MSSSSRLPGFYRLDIAERRRILAALRSVDGGEFAALDAGGIDVDTADGMIENVIGTYALPLGVAVNFVVNGIDYVVPMAVEEASVVAAASNAARMVREGGGFHAELPRPLMIGQVQLTDVADSEAGKRAIGDARDELLARARELTPRLSSRGGGLVDIEVRSPGSHHPSAAGMLVVHLVVDCCDAMGANLVNSLAEGLADRLAELAGGAVGLRILSNLADRRLITVTARVPERALGLPGAGRLSDQDSGAAVVRRAIVDASLFAELDPYRAATHNKGIMNGVDAVLLATGNDWRSVEAGAHAYAAMGGQYRPLATWHEDGDDLVGTLCMPMAVGTVGGALHVHRGARLGLAMLGTRSAGQLAAVVGAAGMASNLAALRALATDGIQRGHMSLHARVVARAAGATGELIDRVASEIAALGDVKTERARAVIDRLRAEQTATSHTRPGPMPGRAIQQDSEASALADGDQSQSLTPEEVP
ncbi:MAG: hydroxymethylglutaryl-CoA reductase, degradative [Proteobacteria bacterium]|nr:hydroxymethylglutaryl-CoA reductase, degradative [Pseudomonadota bacterium]